MSRIARAVTSRDHVSYGLVEGESFVPLPHHVFGQEIGVRGRSESLSAVSLLSPCEPRNILLMWKAFRKPGDPAVDHAPYLSVKATGEPPTGHLSEIQIPKLVGGPLAAEAELAVVIGRRARNVSPDDAWQSVAGLTVMNDVTSPALIHPSGTWPEELPRLVSGAVMAKCFDTFAPFGPWIETEVTEAAIRDGLAITTTVNGIERISGSTRDFKFSVSEVVSHASRVMTLNPGDLITLGTPGVVLVEAGDVVECSVEGVGTLKNTVVDPSIHEIHKSRGDADV